MESHQSHVAIDYPYVASKEKMDLLMAGYIKLKTGMKKEMVIEILGEPDEINSTFDKNDWNKRIGYSYIYLLKRLKKDGSVDEKKESLIRVMFDLEDKVAEIDKW